jgi:hypothetical protein
MILNKIWEDWTTSSSASGPKGLVTRGSHTLKKVKNFLVGPLPSFLMILAGFFFKKQPEAWRLAGAGFLVALSAVAYVEAAGLTSGEKDNFLRDDGRVVFFFIRVKLSSGGGRGLKVLWMHPNASEGSVDRCPKNRHRASSQLAFVNYVISENARVGFCDSHTTILEGTLSFAREVHLSGGVQVFADSYCPFFRIVSFLHLHYFSHTCFNAMKGGRSLVENLVVLSNPRVRFLVLIGSFVFQSSVGEICCAIQLIRIFLYMVQRHPKYWYAPPNAQASGDSMMRPASKASGGKRSHG